MADSTDTPEKQKLESPRNAVVAGSQVTRTGDDMPTNPNDDLSGSTPTLYQTDIKGPVK